MTYTIISDYGYGDRSILGYYEDAQEFVDAYNEFTGNDCKTAEEVLDIWNEGMIYQTFDYEYEEDENFDWMDS